jgi:hypothetical protein
LVDGGADVRGALHVLDGPKTCIHGVHHIHHRLVAL